MAHCEVCLGLRLDHTSHPKDRSWCIRVKDDLTLEYYLDFVSRDLSRACKMGCRSCWTVAKGLMVISSNLRLFDAQGSYQGRFILQEDCPLEVEVFGVQTGKNFMVRVQFYSLLGSELSQCFGVARDVPYEITAERCISIIKGWVDDCCLSHKGCVRENKQTSLPTRILDLREWKPERPLVLIESPGLKPQIQTSRYATLSHCWGTNDVIRTTRSSLSRRLLGIQWTELPKTYQDAITIVTALDVHFLWIDSLCIIQDDLLDWKRESARMASIYSNSYINIAATGAADSRVGCFSPRSIKHVSQCFRTTSFEIKTDSGAQVFVRPSFDSIHHSYSAHSTSQSNQLDTTTAPLLSRAWVFQERHLAPRTLHFHPSEMIMECRSSLYCECTGLDHVVSRSRRGSLDLKSLDNREVLDRWLEVVEQFSRLRLTFESDRLPALLGVATVFQQRLGCGYLAGLWQTDIARGLLWDTTRYQGMPSPKNTRRQQNPFAPTWSWASLILQVEGTAIVFPASHDDTFKPDEHFFCLDKDTPLHPIVTEPCQNIDDAITIRSKVVSAVISYQENSPSGKKTKIIFGQDCDDMIWINTVGVYQDVTWCVGEPYPVEDGTVVNCSLLGSTEERDWFSGRNETYLCILVLKPSSRIIGAWERVGVLDLRKSLGTFDGASEITLLLV